MKPSHSGTLREWLMAYPFTETDLSSAQWQHEVERFKKALHAFWRTHTVRASYEEEPRLPDS